ncbi:MULTISPECIES: helix-turn-helix transcriptional regulator [unclassified Streptomyces]|uniref:helix-turn-helix transcriptional regulator n=1 Tax=unclassified Streptomyces TaxID=2593676 RepID=UPI00380B5A46
MGRELTSSQVGGPSECFLTTEEVAARYRTSPATVRWWRQVGNYGPQGIKVGRRVLYSLANCEEFERQQAAAQAAKASA